MIGIYLMTLRTRNMTETAKLIPRTIICIMTDLMKHRHVAGKNAVILYP